MAMSRRKFLQVCGLGLTTVAAGSLVGCGGSDNSAATTAAAGGDVANKDKPVVFFNRQPSNSSTGELDMTTLNWNANTYYVGFDANQGGELEGQMVVDYIKEHIDTIDRNGDGVIGYVLAIGDVGHNDSIARTRGCRKALGTAVEQNGAIVSEAAGTNVDGSATVVKDGELEVNGKKYIVRELASQEMKNSAGATWDAATAGNALGSWATSFGDQIDVIVSNNDGMGMAMFNAWSKENKVPTFGYDANSDAVAAIAEGYAGTISQNPAVQAYLTLRLLRNSLDGVDINTGISKADDAGNVLAEDDYKYSEEDRSYYAMSLAVTPRTPTSSPMPPLCMTAPRPSLTPPRARRRRSGSTSTTRPTTSCPPPTSRSSRSTTSSSTSRLTTSVATARPSPTSRTVSATRVSTTPSPSTW